MANDEPYNGPPVMLRPDDAPPLDTSVDVKEPSPEQMKALSTGVPVHPLGPEDRLKNVPGPAVQPQEDSGGLIYDPTGRAMLVSPKGVMTSTRKDQAQARLGMGYRPATLPEVSKHVWDQEHEAPATAFGLGVARGATFGLSDVGLTSDLSDWMQVGDTPMGPISSPESLRAYKEKNPTASFLGNVGGQVGLMLATGGESEAAGTKGLAETTELTPEAAQALGKEDLLESMRSDQAAHAATQVVERPVEDEGLAKWGEGLSDEEKSAALDRLVQRIQSRPSMGKRSLPPAFDRAAVPTQPMDPFLVAAEQGEKAPAVVPEVKPEIDPVQDWASKSADEKSDAIAKIIQDRYGPNYRPFGQGYEKMLSEPPVPEGPPVAGPPTNPGGPGAAARMAGRGPSAEAVTGPAPELADTSVPALTEHVPPELPWETENVTEPGAPELPQTGEPTAVRNVGNLIKTEQEIAAESATKGMEDRFGSSPVAEKAAETESPFGSPLTPEGKAIERVLQTGPLQPGSFGLLGPRMFSPKELAKDFGWGAAFSLGDQISEDALGDDKALMAEQLLPAVLEGGLTSPGSGRSSVRAGTSSVNVRA